MNVLIVISFVYMKRMPSGQACIYARSSGPKQKETSISGSRLYYGVHLHNATNNTREVEGGPKTLTRACYRALFDVVNRIRSIDHHACDPRIQNYPSGAKKPVPKAVATLCAEFSRCDRVAIHEMIVDTTKDAADRLMIQKAAVLHAELPMNVAFLFVTNDRLLAKSLGSLLAARNAVHWPHLYIPKTTHRQ